MPRPCLTRFGFLGGLVFALAAAGHPAAAQNPVRLRYGFQPNRQYAYEVKIHADLEDSDDFREGVLTYAVTSAEAEKVVLQLSGSLPSRIKPKPNQQAGGPFAGPPHFMGPPPFMGPPQFGFGGGPQGITINRQGELVVSRELTSLPFALGDMETLTIEEFPADNRNAWDKQRDIVVAERKSSGPFPHMMFGPFRPQSDSTRRTAKERTDYSILEVRGELVRMSKRYQLRTEEQAAQAPRFAMSGAGEFTFNSTEGVNQAMEMKYQIQINEPNSQLRVPVTVHYRLLSAEEVAALKKQAEETRAAAEKANAPKPMTDQERPKLLRELRSGDPQRIQTAADRLAKATVDDNPAVVAKALAPLLRHPNEWVQGAVASALEVWATPEAEAALIKATTSENLWVRARAINALGKLKSEAAAEAVAAQMYRNRGEAGKALKAMGPIAEAATIPCLKDRDAWVRGETCRVLAEIGGEDALKALKESAGRATGFEKHGVDNAIGAIRQRLDSASDEPAPPAAKTAKPSRAKTSASGTEEIRTWHDTSGLFEVEASFQSYQDKKVTLKKKDGSVMRVPIEKLSPDDHVYILEHSQSQAPQRAKAVIE